MNTTWHEDIQPGVPDPTGKRWYCVATDDLCCHVRSISPRRAMDFAGTPYPGARSTLQPDRCQHSGEVIAKTAA